MTYTHDQLVRIAQRANNKKRGYLVVNPLQGKHIPADPTASLAMFNALADLVSYPGERLLVIGFAETATAIGSALAVALDCHYIQTTREPIDGVSFLYFTESHSHATEQKLVAEDITALLPHIDRIVFAEDEVTTGNTILKLVNLLKATYDQPLSFAVASLLNGMDEDALARYKDAGIATHYLLKTDHSTFETLANALPLDGAAPPTPQGAAPCVPVLTVAGLVNPRRATTGAIYSQGCALLWESVSSLDLTGRVLVLGTEECMYPAIFIGDQLRKQGVDAWCHATTRSPIAVSTHDDYPLHCRETLPSVYDDQRTTHVYDLGQYDAVVIVTDAKDVISQGMEALILALNLAGNGQIEIVRWAV